MYPIFDALAASFNLLRSKVHEYAHRLAKSLARTLHTRGILLPHAIDPLVQMQAVFADVCVLLLVATERPYHWAQTTVDQVADYTGKKRPPVKVPSSLNRLVVSTIWDLRHD